MNYIDDTPIQSAENDLLNRSNFSNTLAEAIINLPPSEQSIIIGIIGKWGYGKSSILNMVEEYINQKSMIITERPLIFRFNPWYFPEQTNLIESFFSELILFLKEKGMQTEYLNYLRKYKFKLLKYGAYLAEDGINLVNPFNRI